MPIFSNITQSFATVLDDELASIQAAREAKGVYSPVPKSKNPPAGVAPPVDPPPPAAPDAQPVLDAPPVPDSPVLGAGEPKPSASLIDKAKDASAAFWKETKAVVDRGSEFLKELLKPGQPGAPPETVYTRALDEDLVGLSISGGGIRSATLSLGILQGLAVRGLLRHIDYLSTVSGGGYIGSWLVSWIHRTRASAGTSHQALKDVEKALNPDSPGESRESIHQLRRYSNYLTPDTSLLRADTWVIAAIWTRNTLLNLIVVIFGICLFLMAPRFGGYYLPKVNHSPLVSTDSYVALISLLVSAVSIGVSLYLVNNGETSGPGQTGVQWFAVLPLMIGSSAMAEWMLRSDALFVTDWLMMPTAIGFVLYAIPACCSGFPKCFAANHKNLPGAGFFGYFWALLWSLLSGVLLAVLLHGLALLAGHFRGIPLRASHIGDTSADWLPWAVLCCGPPLILISLSLAMILLIGLMGHDLEDDSREWLGRLRAWTFIYTMAWLLITGISIYGPWVIYWARSTKALSIGAIWGAISASGLFAGKSAKTDGQSSGAPDWKDLARDAITRIAPFVFIIGFATAIAFGVHELVSPAAGDLSPESHPISITLATSPQPVTLSVGAKPTPPGHFEKRERSYAQDLCKANVGFWAPTNIDFFNLGSLFALVTLGGLLLSWRVDINDFSMHHFYKNRLVRCYLGASRHDPKSDPFTGFIDVNDQPGLNRKPDPFTGFDDADDMPLHNFAAVADYCGPYPILNGALNLAGGSALAWQERKAASFIFTPRYCGYDKPQIDREAGNPKKLGIKLSPEAYTPTGNFAYESGIRIGTAMGISGAAANPNAGYHTSTAVAFLLTIFNLRLGWWLGNPARSGKADNPGPTFGLTYLITELFGLASSDKAYVNVSDGGHFENLGIYELVRRHCRYIITCDGEQDSGLKFEGLANAIRKCRTDFDVEIDIDVDQIRLKDGYSRSHCVVGCIHYPGDTRPAYLLYLKSSLTGNEETDILQYHSAHADFPHQSTGDQWFDESQFESYRKLGFHIVDAAFGGDEAYLDEGYMDAESYKDAKKDLFKNLWEMLYPPSDAIQKSFTKHTADYSKLVGDIAKTQALSYLDPTIFEKWNLAAASNREGRYRCISFLQLIEDVYIDLQLDDPVQRAHPHNAGWLNLFRQWAGSAEFRDAWKVAGDTYGMQFQKFYLSLIDDHNARVQGNWTPTVAPNAVVPGLTEIELFVDRKKHIIQGMVLITAAAVTKSLDVIDASFTGDELTFSLRISPAPAAPAVHRMRLDRDGKTATLTNAANAGPTVLCR